MRIGVLGAGQLGRMLALAGHPLGFELVCLDPARDAPAGQVTEHLAAPYDDELALARLAACDVVTYEFESVPVATARELARTTPVHPSPDALAIAQDRWTEKSCFRELGIPTAPFARVDSEDELRAAVDKLGLPSVLKTRRFGYDGKGQSVLCRDADIESAWRELGRAPLILEGFVRFQRELSLLSVRSTTGETAFYPLIENEHSHGILRLSRAPARALTPALQATAEDYGRRLLDRLGYAGVLALELFEEGGTLLANEMAPRVHNSGHFSIEGAVTSQFENHLRAITGLPLGSTALRAPAAMLNFVGAPPEPALVLAVPDAHLHLYGKEPRPGRKLGHATVLAPDETTRETRIASLEKTIAARDDGR